MSRFFHVCFRLDFQLLQRWTFAGKSSAGCSMDIFSIEIVGYVCVDLLLGFLFCSVDLFVCSFVNTTLGFFF